MRHRVHLEVSADYHQFYVWDPVASEQKAPEDWSDEDVQVRAKVTDHVFVLCPARNTTVPFTLEIHESEPEFQAAEWDHIVHASIKVPSGRVEVHECTGGSHAELSVAPGIFRLRALYKALDSITEDQLGGRDSYVIALWPGEYTPLRVLKSHSKDA